MNENIIKLKYEVNDLQTCYQYHWKYLSFWRSKVMVFLGLICIFSSILFTILSKFNPINQFLLVYGIFLIIYYLWAYKTYGKRMFKKQPNLLHEFQVILNEDNIIIGSTQSETKMQWTSYEKAVIEKDYILLYINKLLFHFLPRNKLTSQQDQFIINKVKNNISEYFLDKKWHST